MSGGLVVQIKKLAQSCKYIDTQLENILCIWFSRVLFATQQDMIMLFTYVHLQNSFWYRYASVDCDLENLDTCVTNLIREYGDNYFLICGDLNSRAGQANLYEAITLNDHCPWSNTDTCDTEYVRKSEDKVTNQFGEQLVQFFKNV